MQTENIQQANLSMPPTMDGNEQCQEQEFVIARNDRSTTKLSPVKPTQSANRIGVAKGRFAVPDTIDTHNDVVARLFLGGARS
jgi:hypothetical protein